MTGAIAVGVIFALNQVAFEKRLDEIFATWDKAKSEFKSLQVEGKRINFDILRSRDDANPFKLQLFRTSKGTLRGGYRDKELKNLPFTGQIDDSSVYWACEEEKFCRSKPANGDVTGFLARNFNPVILLLDRKRAEEKYRIRVTKSDANYTYILIEPKKGVYRDFSFSWHVAQVVGPNREIGSIPRNFPIRIWWRGSGVETRHDITRWHLNGPEKLEMESTPVPEKYEELHMIGMLFEPIVVERKVEPMLPSLKKE